MFLLNNACINTFGFLVSEMPACGVVCIAVVDVNRDHCVRNFKKSSASAKFWSFYDRNYGNVVIHKHVRLMARQPDITDIEVGHIQTKL